MVLVESHRLMPSAGRVLSCYLSVTREKVELGPGSGGNRLDQSLPADYQKRWLACGRISRGWVTGAGRVQSPRPPKSQYWWPDSEV